MADNLTGASATATVNAFHDTTFLELGFWNTANAICAEICVTRLNASKTAQVFVTGFLPFCYQIGIGNFLGNTIIIQLATDRLSAVKQIVNIT